MSKRPNRYKKKKRKSKNTNIYEHMVSQPTADEPERKRGNQKWQIAALFLFLFALWLGSVYLTEPDMGGFLLSVSTIFIQKFPHMVYAMAGSMIVSALLWAILFFLLLDHLPLDHIGLKKLILLCVFGIALGFVCKMCGFPDFYFAILLGGFAVVQFLDVKKNREIKKGESVSYCIKWLLFWGLLMLLCGVGLFSMIKEYPYKLHGKIQKVYCHERIGESKAGLFFYKQIEYAIAEPDGRMIDDTRYAGHYEVPSFYNGFTSQGNSFILQRQMDKEGSLIWVRGRYDYCRGELITLREQYFSVFICFVCFVQTTLCLYRLLRHLNRFRRL